MKKKKKDMTETIEDKTAKALTIKDVIREIGDRFLFTKSVSVSYEGSGDSFDDFWAIQVEYKDKDGKDNNKIQVGDVEDLLWYAIEHSEADFNNEGSTGEIEIDFVNGTLKINNYYIVRESVPSGQLEFRDEKFKKVE